MNKSIEEFREDVKKYIYKLFTEIKVKDCDVIKNNGIKFCGICIVRNGEHIFPTIYLEEYYEKYLEGISIEEISNEIIRFENSVLKPQEFDVEKLEDFSNVKNNIYAKIVNSKQNEKLLKDIPYREFLDLSVIAYCDVSDMCGMGATFLIKNEHIRAWGVSPEKILDTAIDNTRKREIKILDIADVIGDVSETDVCEDLIFVMTNEQKIYGAVSMIYDDIMDKFLENSDYGVYIIPSSVHEVILIPDNDKMNKNDLNRIIKTVNAESLESAEVLSDHAYYYSSSEGYIMV